MSSRLKWDTLTAIFIAKCCVAFCVISYLILDSFPVHSSFKLRYLLFGIVQIAVDVMGFYFESIYSPILPTITKVQAEKVRKEKRIIHILVIVCYHSRTSTTTFQWPFQGFHTFCCNNDSKNGSSSVLEKITITTK